MQLNNLDKKNVRSYGNLSQQIDESLEAIGLDEMDDMMDKIDNWDDESPVVESVPEEKAQHQEAPLIAPVVAPVRIDEVKEKPSKVDNSSFKKRLQQLKKANTDLIEKTKKELETQIIDFDASSYVLEKDTKSFVIETLKKEGLEVSESSRGYEVNLDF